MEKHFSVLLDWIPIDWKSLYFDTGLQIRKTIRFFAPIIPKAMGIIFSKSLVEY